jgi:hypothetical protein
MMTLGPEAGPKGQIYRLVTQETYDTLGPEAGPKGQIWACDTGNR